MAEQTDKRSGRGRPKKIADTTRREQIVAQAKQLFMEKGFGRTTTAEITSRCRISKQTLYKLFPDKFSLFAAVVDAHRAQMLRFDEAYDDLPLDQGLEKIFMLDISPAEDQARVDFLRTVTAESTRFPELRDILQLYGGDKSRSQLAAWLGRQQQRGRIRVDNLDSASRMLMDMLFGTVVFKSLGDFQWPCTAHRLEHARRCIDVFLHGVTPREESPSRRSPDAP